MNQRAKKKRGEQGGSTTASGAETTLTLPDERSFLHDQFVHLIILLLTGFIVYGNSIAAPFIFDDYMNLVNNPAIRSFNCFPDTARVFDLAIPDTVKQNFFLRPVCFFTFAVNYAVHGYGNFGYHLTNMVIHIANAMLVYLLLFRMLAKMPLIPSSCNDARTGDDSLRLIALFAALVFLCHPIQTQSVTYIFQRAVPLATLFCLGALLLYDVSRTSPAQKTRVTSYLIAIIAMVLAMGSKEMAFTFPVIILAYELMFFEGGIAPRLVKTVPFLLTMSIIPLRFCQLVPSQQSLATENLSGSLAFRTASKATSLEYLMTQFGVITTYLRLLFFPAGQNLDYDYPLQKSFFTIDVIAPLLLLLVIAGSGLFFWRRSKENSYYRMIAFGIVWFFITLSIESSFVPLGDLVFEHRIYLPSVGFFMALFTGLWLLYRRMCQVEIGESKAVILGGSAVVVVLALTAIVRNRVWQNEVTIWRDVVSKSPHKARVHDSLAYNLYLSAKSLPASADPAKKQQLLDEAIAEYLQAIRLGTQESGTYTNLAVALSARQRYDQAFKYVEMAARLTPADPLPTYVRGKIYAAKGDLNNAMVEFRSVIKQQPDFYQAYYSLADLLVSQGNVPQAIIELESAVRSYPNDITIKKLEELKRR